MPPQSSAPTQPRSSHAARRGRQQHHHLQQSNHSKKGQGEAILPYDTGGASVKPPCWGEDLVRPVCSVCYAYHWRARRPLCFFLLAGSEVSRGLRLAPVTVLLEGSLADKGGRGEL